MLFCNKSPRVSHYLALMLLEHPKDARLLYWAALDACRLDYGHRPIFVVPRDKPGDTKSVAKEAMRAHQLIPGDDAMTKFQHAWCLYANQAPRDFATWCTQHFVQHRGLHAIWRELEQTIKDLARHGFLIESESTVPNKTENRILCHALSRAFGISMVRGLARPCDA